MKGLIKFISLFGIVMGLSFGAIGGCVAMSGSNFGAIVAALSLVIVIICLICVWNYE